MTRTLLPLALAALLAATFAPLAGAAHNYCHGTQPDDVPITPDLGVDLGLDGNGRVVCVLDRSVIVDESVTVASGVVVAGFTVRDCAGTGTTACSSTLDETGVAAGVGTGGPICHGTFCPRPIYVVYFNGRQVLP